MRKLDRSPARNCALFATRSNLERIWQAKPTSMVFSGFWLLASGFWLLARRHLFGFDGNFVAARFFVAVTDEAFLLRRFLQEIRRVAFRALFGDRLVPDHEVAVRIFKASIEDFAALRSPFGDFPAAAWLRTRHADRLRLNVLALRIVRAGNEFAKAPLAFHQLRVIDRAFFVKHFRRRADFPALGDLADVAAFWITRATEKRAKTPTLQLHLLAA